MKPVETETETEPVSSLQMPESEQTTLIPTDAPSESRARRLGLEEATDPTVRKVGEASLENAAYVLRLLSGPQDGNEIPLRTGVEYVFGRGREADLVLAEDLVSRRHAILSLATNPPTLSDLGSTNGTFVNGERVSKATLRLGDRLLIGTTIARFMEIDAEETKVGGAEKGLLEHGRRQHANSTMAGRLEEVPAVDLLQLFSNSRKGGTLVIRAADGLEGEVVLQAGQIAAARIDGKPYLTHRKALMRLLRIEAGGFEFVPPPLPAGELPPIPLELQEPTELLLMDSLRQWDELRVIEPGLPAASAMLSVARPLPGRLRALEPASLDLFQLVLEQPSFGDVVDHSTLDDLEASRGIVRLVGLGYVKVGV